MTWNDRVCSMLELSQFERCKILPLSPFRYQGEYRRRLVTIYSLRNPSNLAKVDYLLDKYKGREDLLYTSLLHLLNFSLEFLSRVWKWEIPPTKFCSFNRMSRWLNNGTMGYLLSDQPRNLYFAVGMLLGFVGGFQNLRPCIKNP